MSEDNPRLAMYEAQAIAIEKQLEIDKLKAEKEAEIDKLKKEREDLMEVMRRLAKTEIGKSEESSSENAQKEEIRRLTRENEALTERMRLFELEMERKADKSHSKNINDVWTVVNGLTGQFANMQDQMQQINGHITRLQVESKLQNRDGNGFGSGRVWPKPDPFGSGLERFRVRVPETRTVSDPMQNAKNTIFTLDCNHYALVLSVDRTKWIETQLELPHKASGSGVVNLNEEIYLCGGCYYPKRLYKLDRNSLKWNKLADMNIARKYVTNSCLEWNGYIWVFGGMDEKRNRLKSVERYDPIKNKWILMHEMKYGRSNATAVLWNNSIIITGGYSNDGRTNSIEYFKDGYWTELPNLPNSLDDHSLISYKNKLVLIGGSDGKARSEVYEIDPQELTCQPFSGRSNAKWSPLPALKHPSWSHVGIVLDNEIYIIGGAVTNTVEIFDGQKWRDGPSLPFPMYRFPAVIIPQTLANRFCNYRS